VSFRTKEAQEQHLIPISLYRKFTLMLGEEFDGVRGLWREWCRSRHCRIIQQFFLRTVNYAIVTSPVNLQNFKSGTSVRHRELILRLRTV